MNDWEKVIEKNTQRLKKLNLPKWQSKGKVFIFDQYCPYSLNVIDIEPVIETGKFGMHGTFAAQEIKLIAGENVKFYGSGYTADFDSIVDFCIENDIRVISSSITTSYKDHKDQAIKRFAEWGGIWISSAGNNGDRPIMFPGSSKYTIGVTATNTEDSYVEEDTISADSYWYVRNLKPGYFNLFNGTSASCPVIAGCILLILQKRPKWKIAEGKQFLLENSVAGSEPHERVFSFPDGWREEGQAQMKQEWQEIKLTIGSNIAVVDGETKHIDVPAKIENGRTLVPIRFVSEAMGAGVEWNGEKQEITIRRKG